MHYCPYAKPVAIAAVTLVLVCSACKKHGPTEPEPLTPVPELAILLLPSAMEVERGISFRAEIKNAVLGAPVFTWDFGDGVVVSGEDTVSHVYTVPGSYDVILQLMDERSGVDLSAALRINIGASTRPTVEILLHTGRPLLGFPVMFEALASANAPPARDLVWEFGDGSGPVRTDYPFIEHDYMRTGTFLVRVTMIDRPKDSAVATDTMSVTITSTEFRIDITPDTVRSTPGGEVRLRADITSGPIPGYKTYSWDFGNGSTFSVRDSENYSSVTRRYFRPGTFAVIVKLESDYTPGTILARDTAWVVTQ